MKLADLHIHTTFSDGIYTPEEIVKQALAVPLSAIAVTDHDNVAGYLATAEYLKNNNIPLKLVPGVEIDTFYGPKDVHVLGYYFDVANQELLAGLAWTRQGRTRRIKKIVAKINDLGYSLTMEEVLAEAKNSKSYGRPHIARVMVKKAYFPKVQDVFDALIAKGKPAYCEQEKLTPAKAVELIQKAGGIACLAHPSEIEDRAIAEAVLKDSKFNGLEVWHPSALAAKETDYWLELAHKYNLLTSGGSDYHGTGGRFPEQLGVFKIGYKDVEKLIEYRYRKGRRHHGGGSCFRRP